ncbi:FtsQ-type POTRA domain-containing protein [Paenibacillus aurantius]|uniref:FtsQ-type POTRA domain-containing protein n=1 Tax=Paenibacillus aurantius TaxID=2918900 RepID=A0AA96RHN4_9BACL|nr:FtsQ-type POTRA domain-containing protein [Paenibacillus aurantius]WNQ14217.1 FtsQ-type POTRA domain-containing protein [Paenibacillus aurantius]
MKSERNKKPGSRKLLYLLIVFFLIVFAILFFQSSFSKITSIEIAGNDVVSSEQIGQASQAAVGDQFFAVGSSVVEERVKALQTIESVQVTKSFPGKIRIEVKEYPRAAYQLTPEGSIEVLMADGSAYPVKDKGAVIDKPILTNWGSETPERAALCKVLAGINPALLSDISEIKPDPSAAYPDKIKLFTRSQFEVITRIALLGDKIQYLDFMINEFKERNNGATGILTLLDTDRGSLFGKDAGSAETSDGNKDSKKR